jgi:hypothetical protein
MTQPIEMQHILVGLRFSVLCVPRLFDWRYERGATDCGEVDITYRGSHSKTLLLETDKSELCCAVQSPGDLRKQTQRGISAWKSLIQQYFHQNSSEKLELLGNLGLLITKEINQ